MVWSFGRCLVRSYLCQCSKSWFNSSLWTAFTKDKKFLDEKKNCSLIKTTNWNTNFKTSHIFDIGLVASFEVSFYLKYIFRKKKILILFFFRLQKEPFSYFLSLNTPLRNVNTNLTSCITWLKLCSFCILWLRNQLINIYGIWYKLHAIEGHHKLEILNFLRTETTKWCTHELVRWY